MVILQKYLFGIIKRLYWLLPSLLADPFDITERWFGLMYAAPPYLVWVLVGVGLFIASFLTYRELSLENTKITQEAKTVVQLKPRKLDMAVWFNLQQRMIREHGDSDDWGLASDYRDGYPIDKIMSSECSICGKPRNQWKGVGH